ncbi:hypothetical protein GNI_144360 [Gregarina niphandrodes]|uniref:Uncharacterized protein n=1 Tax=Gregarina niphandrodes TaxID=110365 RepID=A0A023B003_GRENI|nr:hypothetical protein GNI_144360 [Gregarina niphandrodes]EZG44735.1 hypothetical protein GNI_144360 [Gregarina niphandrodes]|eukprot:XP_011134129.1 hypothetical protein GNI_144360 [Gregarina niphandrodes]
MVKAPQLKDLGTALDVMVTNQRKDKNKVNRFNLNPCWLAHLRRAWCSNSLATAKSERKLPMISM